MMYGIYRILDGEAADQRILYSHATSELTPLTAEEVAQLHEATPVDITAHAFELVFGVTPADLLDA